MGDEATTTPATTRQRTTLLTGLLALACLAAWSQWRSVASARDTYDKAVQRLEQMQLDAAQIATLRKAPQAATSRKRQSEELLAQIERALSAAGIARTHWHDSLPQPAIRLPQSDYKQLTTRFYFEAITLRQLAAFAHHLEANDPTLRLSALNLTNRHANTSDYDVDLAVSYLVYAPQDHRSHRE